MIEDVRLESLGLHEVRGELRDRLEDLGEWYINIPFLPRQRWLAFFHLARRSATNSKPSA
jgi:hypothetical protein